MPRTETPRQMGFTRLPIRCPACDRRVPNPPALSHGTIVRCPGCRELQYVILVPNVGLAFAATVTAAEVNDMARRGCTALEVLRQLGAFRGAA